MSISALVQWLIKPRVHVTENDVDEICKALDEGCALECADDIWIIARDKSERRGITFTSMWKHNIVYFREDYAKIDKFTGETMALTKCAVLGTCKDHAPQKVHVDGRSELLKVPLLYEGY